MKVYDIEVDRSVSKLSQNGLYMCFLSKINTYLSVGDRETCTPLSDQIFQLFSQQEDQNIDYRNIQPSADYFASPRGKCNYVI